ncbi:hypothetical protein INT45_006225 [Circinella minor]|uniref:SWIM-type domain-containing protein n=1 Tax=Circinella minor TaxID=1195481 RepID=A0A8H7RYJ6_9FUNG|nr:hypothetical protein INT45_006225 [Circinella minor]
MSDSLLLLDAILREISISKELTKENIHLLFILFQETLYEALYLIENNAVKRVKCKTERKLYHVKDIILEMNNKTTIIQQPYTCFIYPRYCSCPEFFNFTINEQKTLMCRHVLAVILGDTLNILENNDSIIDDEEFGELLYRWQVEE